MVQDILRAGADGAALRQDPRRGRRRRGGRALGARGDDHAGQALHRALQRRRRKPRSGATETGAVVDAHQTPVVAMRTARASPDEALRVGAHIGGDGLARGAAHGAGRSPVQHAHDGPLILAMHVTLRTRPVGVQGVTGVGVVVREQAEQLAGRPGVAGGQTLAHQLVVQGGVLDGTPALLDAPAVVIVEDAVVKNGVGVSDRRESGIDVDPVGSREDGQLDGSGDDPLLDRRAAASSRGGPVLPSHRRRAEPQGESEHERGEPGVVPECHLPHLCVCRGSTDGRRGLAAGAQLLCRRSRHDPGRRAGRLWERPGLTPLALLAVLRLASAVVGKCLGPRGRCRWLGSKRRPKPAGPVLSLDAGWAVKGASGPVSTLASSAGAASRRRVKLCARPPPPRGAGLPAKH